LRNFDAWSYPSAIWKEVGVKQYVDSAVKTASSKETGAIAKSEKKAGIK
jgi:hypothetical protein